MADRDVEQAADAAADDGLREQLLQGYDKQYPGAPLMAPVELVIGALLPVVEAHAAAQVAAEREHCRDAAWSLLHRQPDGSWDGLDPHNEAIEAVAARIARGAP
ncbi:MAG: hypothetical protein ACRD0W_21060 [Acidimicrobiales bacterium]